MKIYCRAYRSNSAYGFARSRGRVFFTRLDGYQTDISESQVQSAPAALLPRAPKMGLDGSEPSENCTIAIARHITGTSRLPPPQVRDG